MLSSITTLFLLGLSLCAHVLAQSCFILQGGGQYLLIDGSSGTTNYTTTFNSGYGTIFSVPAPYSGTVTAANAPGSPPKYLPLYTGNDTSAPIRWFSSFTDAGVSATQLYCSRFLLPPSLYGYEMFYVAQCSVGGSPVYFNICNGTLYASFSTTVLPGCQATGFFWTDVTCPTTTTSSNSPKPTKSHRRRLA